MGRLILPNTTHFGFPAQCHAPTKEHSCKRHELARERKQCERLTWQEKIGRLCGLPTTLRYRVRWRVRSGFAKPSVMATPIIAHGSPSRAEFHFAVWDTPDSAESRKADITFPSSHLSRSAYIEVRSLPRKQTKTGEPPRESVSGQNSASPGGRLFSLESRRRPTHLWLAMCF